MGGWCRCPGVNTITVLGDTVVAQVQSVMVQVSGVCMAHACRQARVQAAGRWWQVRSGLSNENPNKELNQQGVRWVVGSVWAPLPIQNKVH